MTIFIYQFTSQTVHGLSLKLHVTGRLHTGSFWFDHVERVPGSLTEQTIESLEGIQGPEKSVRHV